MRDRFMERGVKDSLDGVLDTLNRMEMEVLHIKNALKQKDMGTDKKVAKQTAEQLERLVNYLNQNNYSLTQPLIAKIMNLMQVEDFNEQEENDE